MRGKIGINAAFYIGHCALRRYVMGDAAQEREATPEEIERMAALVTEAMEAGAAGFSSTHSPTHFDSADRPGAVAAVEPRRAQGAHRGGRPRRAAAPSPTCPGSAVGGITPEDEALLIEMSLLSRMPVIIQGLGARSKVDAPTAGLGQRQALRRRGHRPGRGRVLDGDVEAVQPHLQPGRRHEALRGRAPAQPPLHRGVDGGRSGSPSSPTRRSATRCATPSTSPNRDPNAGPTLPPPGWAVLHVNQVSQPEHEKLLGRSLVDIADERGVHPTDAFLDIAAAEDLTTEFLWKTETPEWIEGTRVAQDDPHMIVGTSDGGAHLDRDDGAEAHTWFLEHWVRKWEGFTLEEGVRQITAIPAALCGFTDRGLLLVGYAADLMIFDPDTVGPDQKWLAHDFPNGAARWTSRPKGVHATIVNGVPIVLDGELQTDAGLPGHVLPS